MTGLELVDAHPAPGRSPAGLAWDGRFLWNADYRAGAVYAVDPATRAVARTIICPGVLSGLTWDGTHLWAALLDEGWLYAINPSTHDFDQTLVIDGAGRLGGLTWDGDHLWVVAQQDGRLLAIDRTNGRITRALPIPVAAGGLTHRDGAFWLGVPLAMRYRASTGSFDWVTDEPAFALLVLDAANGRELARHPLSFLPLGLTWASDTLWLTQPDPAQLWRGEWVSG